MASDAPRPEPTQTEPAQPVPAAKPVADNTPVPPAPTPIVNAGATAAQNQEAQEKAMTDTAEPAPEPQTAAAPPVPPSKPGTVKKSEPEKTAAAPAPKAPANDAQRTEAQKTVAQDIANEAYRHQSAPAAKPGYYMQLASTPSREEAPRLWERLLRKYPNALAGLSPTYQNAAVPGKGDYIRVQAGPLTQDQASARCKQLHAVNPKGGCLVFKR
jgi:hypothetical protein